MIARVAAAAAAALAAGTPLAASARVAATLDARSVLFYADTLGLVAHDGAHVALPDGTRVDGDAAYVDVRGRTALIAGRARITRAGRTLRADAVAVELDGDAVTLLDAERGALATTRALGPPSPVPLVAARFAFPDRDERGAYVAARRAAITLGAAVRLSPASFPGSVGAVPVPSYLYVFPSAAGFAAGSLGAATFDQPYGLVASPTALTAVHARWLDSAGAAVALQQQIVGGDDGYLAASIDAPLRGDATRALTAYRRLGPHATVTLHGSASPAGGAAQATLARAMALGTARLQLAGTSYGFRNIDASLRTPDRPLAFGATWSVLASAGYDALPGGVVAQLPDRARWGTLWYHGLDASIATPVVRGPWGTRFAATADARRTWYAFPHHIDARGGSATLSRTLSRRLTVFASYTAQWTADVYPTAQALFYPPTLLPALAPDGTPWPDRGAYAGAGTLRDVSLTVQATPNDVTSVRLAVDRTADFPQFHGYGRPVWEVRADARLRPAPNVGLQIGRAYAFGWGGTRWVPRWTFAITP